MTGADHGPARREVAILVAVTASVLMAGVILYAAGYNEAFASGNDGFRAVFEALTELGNEKLYLVVLTFIYLSYDKRMGRRMCLVFFLAIYFMDLLKESFQDPRPPSNAERDEPVPGYGFPSGHATTAVTFYGYLVYSDLPNPRYRLPVTVLCLFAMVVVPVSRLVIGAHDVQDVVGGAVLALMVLVSYMVLLPMIAPTVRAWPVERQLAIGVPGALLLWLAAAAVVAVHQSVDPVMALDGTAMGPGLLLGCAIAFPIEEGRVGYSPEMMAPRHRLLAAVVGLPVTVVTYAVMAGASGLVLPGYLAKFLTYTVLVTVLALLVPMMLKRLMVAEGTGEIGLEK